MPWSLTTAILSGDLADSDLGEVKIVRQRHDSKRGMIHLRLSYGNTVDGEWVSGPTPPGKKTSITIEGQDYIDFIVANQATYDAVKAALYGKLETDGVVDGGSVT